MNRIYILGEVLSVSKVHFDYYNKLKAYFKFSISDMCGNEFLCIVQEKRITSVQKTFDLSLKCDLEDVLTVVTERKVTEKLVFVICSLENGEYVVDNIY